MTPAEETTPVKEEPPAEGKQEAPGSDSKFTWTPNGKQCEKCTGRMLKSNESRNKDKTERPFLKKNGEQKKRLGVPMCQRDPTPPFCEFSFSSGTRTDSKNACETFVDGKEEGQRHRNIEKAVKFIRGKAILNEGVWPNQQ